MLPLLQPPFELSHALFKRRDPPITLPLRGRECRLDLLQCRRQSLRLPAKCLHLASQLPIGLKLHPCISPPAAVAAPWVPSALRRGRHVLDLVRP